MNRKDYNKNWRKKNPVKEYIMKEFEKWWLMEAQNIVGVGRATEKNIAEEAWKAALEWALDNRKPYYDEDKKVVATDSDIIYKEIEE